MPKASRWPELEIRSPSWQLDDPGPKRAIVMSVSTEIPTNTITASVMVSLNPRVKVGFICDR
ncbi:hypothetical protein KIN20_031586 [Parelaphostrongylus tenuis]|uniref:Uncharacterized protein n=1 Tax=Parelaphostrongylus tenuis TaxID=148309 RepID=A0AAD5WHD1_PARTN|nr:hypothetical protein KIN20_031586 [Parelaphostrongylus tenuis]